MSNATDMRETAQNDRAKHLPTRVILKPKSTAAELNFQLRWSKPALTVVDVRDAETFDLEHIIGAISVPFARLEDLARSALDRHRHIYIYGDDDEQSLAAAQTLRRVGFINVTQIIGNLAAWREVAGSINTLDSK